MTTPYTPTEWQCNDVITAEKPNHIEQGIVDAQSGGSVAPLIVDIEEVYDEQTSTRSYIKLLETNKTIYDAFESGRPVYVNAGNAYQQVILARTVYSCGNQLYEFGVPWFDTNGTIGGGEYTVWSFGSSSGDDGYAICSN